MASRKCVYLGFAVFAVLCTQVLSAGDFCGSGLDDIKYCEYGCCFNYCCLSTGAIIGIAAGAVAFLVLIVTCCVCCIGAACRR